MVADPPRRTPKDVDASSGDEACPTTARRSRLVIVDRQDSARIITPCASRDRGDRASGTLGAATLLRVRVATSVVIFGSWAPSYLVRPLTSGDIAPPSSPSWDRLVLSIPQRSEGRFARFRASVDSWCRSRRVTFCKAGAANGDFLSSAEEKLRRAREQRSGNDLRRSKIFVAHKRRADAKDDLGIPLRFSPQRALGNAGGSSRIPTLCRRSRWTAMRRRYGRSSIVGFIVRGLQFSGGVIGRRHQKERKLRPCVDCASSTGYFC